MMTTVAAVVSALVGMGALAGIFVRLGGVLAEVRELRGHMCEVRERLTALGEGYLKLRTEHDMCRHCGRKGA
jgi:hypothetical protein